ncbi:hypothetical protein [Actinoplanes couchii]|uniref:Uncharacterized protein n=1 Tax=Actinoplanes couchii TaxID=403638 RepID=A0ABQ3X670_9ACTN|nr:hypothetical protein [Actinoplanes couchii]MDR6325283.1 hypothetical protein [Actinoplanes couchii]GID54013.1 hypothetical protein Aco03nite_024170 [Actinoplanes couchii]
MSEMVGKLKKWFAVALAVVTVNVVFPAQAWAADAEPALAAVRRSRGGGGFLFFGMFCCLAVVVGAVVIVYLITRRRKR